MKFKFFSIHSPFLLFLFLFLFSANHSLLNAQSKADEIDKLIQQYYDYGLFTGVAEHGKIIFKKGYGFANLEWDIPNDVNTKFRLGSITKQFTSMLIMQLVEDGKIRLDGKINDYLPTYRKDIGERVTIHHLLTHTSGIPSYTSLPGFFNEISRDPYSVDEFLDKYCSGNLEFEPGAKFSYSNSGYFILGAIIEKVTGKSYETVLKERILNPLNMKSTGYDHFDQIIKHRATGYEKTFDGYKNAAYLDMTIPFAAGAMYSTAEDLYVWDQALYTNKLISNKYKKLIFKPYVKTFKNYYYGYGWDISKISLYNSKDSLVVISHGGGINGFNTLITRLIKDKNLIILLNNTEYAPLHSISKSIINILYGKDYELPKKSIAEAVYKKIKEKDIESAIIFYKKMKEKYSKEYLFNPSELNRLGYQLLRNKRVDEAIEIFKLNVQEYPKNSNAYDSLGEAYMEKGEKELAIKNYAKSLELNPKNKNAIMMLKKIIE